MDASTWTANRRQRMAFANYLQKKTQSDQGCRPIIRRQPGSADASFMCSYDAGAVETTGPERAEILLVADCVHPVPPPPPPTPSDYTFFTFTTYNSQPNYYYRLYLPATETWTDLIDSGFSTADYSYSGTSWTENKDFFVMYQKDNVMYVQFLSGTSIVRTISFSTANNYSYDYYKSSFFYWTKETTDYTLGLYVFATDTLYETTLTFTDQTDIDRTFLLTESVALFIYNQNTNEYTAYNFNSSNTPSSLFTTIGYTTRSSDTAVFGLTRNYITDYYIDVFKITNTGVETYTLPTETYDSHNHRTFGLNYQNYSVILYNTNTSMYDAYIFRPSSPFTSPIIKTDISGNYNTYYFNDDVYLTEQSEHFIIAEYSNYNNMVNGNIYVLMEGGSNFVTYPFDGQNTFSFGIALNQDTVMIPWSDGTNYLSKIITNSGSSDTTLLNPIPIDFNYSYSIVMKHSYIHLMYNNSYSQKWLFFIKNDNTLVESQSSADWYNINAGGDVATVRISATNTMAVIYNNGFHPLDSFFGNGYNIYPDLGQSITFAYRQDNSENNVLILTETGPQYQTVPILDNYSTTMATDDYIVFYKSNPHTIYVVTRDAQVYSLVTSIATTGSYNIYNTDKDTLIYYTDSNTDLRSYTVFSRGTNTFSTITESSTLSNNYSVYPNYPYQSYD